MIDFRAAITILAILGSSVTVFAQAPEELCLLENVEVVCSSDLGASDYNVSFDLINNSGFDLHKLVIPGNIAGISVSPNIISFSPPVIAGGVAVGVSIQLVGGSAGEEVCLPIGGISIDAIGEEYQCCGLILCVELPSCEILFIRGDSNADGSCDIGDAVNVLSFLFGGGSCPCADSCDCNDDGQVNIADAICKLSFLFSGGPPPPTPHPSCGSDPTADSLGCLSFPPCN